MFFRLSLIISLASLLGACAHQIVISPLETTVRGDATISSKKVAYVMTDVERNKEVTTKGGGSDMVSYFPYRDLEKAIRDALRAVYSDVIVIKSSANSSAIQGNDISFVFTPEISTSSSSSSKVTWPPTQFAIDLSCNVTDPVGNSISIIKVVGNGSAENSEFKGNFGLAGRRAATDLSEKLKQKISADLRLH